MTDLVKYFIVKVYKEAEMNGLEELLEKKNKTDYEEMDMERSLKEYAREHNITFDNEYGYQ